MAEELLDYALCTVDDVRLALLNHDGSALGQKVDDSIKLLINHFTVSAESSRWCNRGLRIEERVEYHDGGWHLITLGAPPVVLTDDNPLTPDISVWEASDRDFDAATELTLWTDYAFSARGQNAALLERNGCWPAGPRTVKVRYQGGLVTAASDIPGAAPPTVPYDLRVACAKQVAAWWTRKLDLGLSAVSTPGMGSVTFMQDPTKVLDDTKRVLLRYKVWR